MRIPRVGTFICPSNFFWLLVLMIIMLLVSSKAISANNISYTEINDHINNELIPDPVVLFNTIEKASLRSTAW
jgi:hypothetical protein